MALDTKWKIPERGRPADDDLRQVFAYLHTFGGREDHADRDARHAAYVAPGRSGAQARECSEAIARFLQRRRLAA